MDLQTSIQDTHDRLLIIYRRADSIDTTGQLSYDLEDIIFRLKEHINACEVE